MPIDANGVARIELEGADAADATALSRMQRQLQDSLATAGVHGVELMVDGSVVSSTPSAVQPTRVDTRALVRTGDGLGWLSGDAFDRLPGFADSVEALDDAVALELGPDMTTAAVRTQTGVVARVRADGAEPIQAIDERPQLIDPTIDAAGWIWSVPQASPRGLRATGPDATVVGMPDAWPGATAVRAMQLSRDGSRLAAVVAVGDRHWVTVSAVRRDGNGVPTGVGEATRVFTTTSQPTDLAWVDETSLGIVSPREDDTRIVLQTVGGPATVLPSAPAGITGISGVNAASQFRIFGSGTVLTRRGAGWLTSAVDVILLATLQGPGA